MIGMDRETLERIGSVFDDAVFYHEVTCPCGYREPCWLKEEAMLRGEIHDEMCDTDLGFSEVRTILAGKDSPVELGLVEEGDESAPDKGANQN